MKTIHRSSTKHSIFACLLTSISLSSVLFAEQHTGGVPVLNSRPGAAYTIYLDFAGFTMPTGQNWAAGVKLPYDGNKR